MVTRNHNAQANPDKQTRHKEMVTVVTLTENTDAQTHRTHRQSVKPERDLKLRKFKLLPAHTRIFKIYPPPVPRALGPGARENLARLQQQEIFLFKKPRRGLTEMC